MTRQAKVPPAHDLPPITELGRILGTIARREAAIDLVGSGQPSPANEEERRARASQQIRLNIADRLLFDRLTALRSVVGTLPAQTLSDCVVQINVAAHWIMRMTCNDLDPSDIKECSDNLERIVISVLPVMAAAAGMDLVEFALNEVTDLHEGRFSEMAT